MKRIWNSVGKSVKDANFQKKAVNYVGKLEEGSEKVVAPKVPTEQKRFENAQTDDLAKMELAKKHENLVDNMHKMKITSVDPPERVPSDKVLPTRESEWLHRNDPIWEYGFYEPDASKIPKNKLMFREALESEVNLDEQSSAASKRRADALTFLENHIAVKRVDDDLLNKMFQYFRPFERKDIQKVVNKHDLARLQDHLQQKSDDKLPSNDRKWLPNDSKLLPK